MRDDRKPWFSAFDNFATVLVPNTWQAWSCIGLLVVAGIGGAALVQAVVRNPKTALWVNLGLWFAEAMVFVFVAYSHIKKRVIDRRPPDRDS